MKKNQNSPLLSIQHLSKSFGGLKALTEVNIEVLPGEILSIIGPNGSGKTTLFNLISGLYQPDGGKIQLHHAQNKLPINLIGLAPHQIIAQGVARTFQNIRLFANMTVLENIMVGLHCRTKTGTISAIFKTKASIKEEKRVLRFAQHLLSSFSRHMLSMINQPAKALSYADRRRLEIVRALASGPKLILLDEPAAGMNPRETQELMNDLRNLCSLGYTLMVIEHDMMMVKGLSDKVIAFDYGCNIAKGSFEEVRHNERVIEAYLGRKHAAT